MSDKKKAELLMKFQNVESLKDYGGMDYDIAQECTEIADNHAQSIAIEFAEWCAINYQYNETCNYWHDGRITYKSDTLFAIFMAERQSNE